METIRDFCIRHDVSKQRVGVWIKEERLKAELINFRWELEEDQEAPKKKGRGKATKQQRGLGIVKQYTLEGELVAKYLNSVEASKAVGTSTANLAIAMNKPHLTAKGFVWKRNDLS